jgi:hypothetical protein
MDYLCFGFFQQPTKRVPLLPEEIEGQLPRPTTPGTDQDPERRTLQFEPPFNLSRARDDLDADSHRKQCPHKRCGRDTAVPWDALGDNSVRL